MTLVWTISYIESARRQLRKLDKQAARHILDFMDERIAAQEDPRNTGKALTGPILGAYWSYRIGDYRIICDIQDGALCVLVIEIGNRREVCR
jgi:mRNA interferase RelE/StbE